MKKPIKIAIIGGGLAGLTAALHLCKAGFYIQLFEKESYPRHKVCGEYISNEILPYWHSLGIDPFKWGAIAISNFEFTTTTGQPIQTQLPLGGFGISRYTLDFNLAAEVKKAGAKLVRAQVESVFFKEDSFELQVLSGAVYHADFVIGSFGKRSNLDISLSRNFIKTKTPWLGVKAHYLAPVTEDTVSLHNFKGGYCGISKVENDKVNVCYLTHLDAFKASGNLEGFQRNVLEQNPRLKSFFASAAPVFDKPLSISQISFQSKNTVEDHVLMCGDSAGLIHPLCGNGMAMAITGAQILATCIQELVISDWSRSQLEHTYTTRWNKEFNSRLKTGRILQGLLQNETATHYSLQAMRKFPFLMKQIIKSTHGKPASF
ncbi:NAD(P)/FAD-dependent oxidoreductase [Leeuwenhoekiella sp. MAR_2009_132]|uniref:NAD(P)/FAD-dependent oxidoreductase n=1 Tax=Leeuwenhoekiella sp. MAR_2009_132 TaxID=1392489 RepID=UPI00048B104B|nr:NAD(P)/FAD-dependent oxidoreductase [Leeuwenhoekiella sp. MAR_2009_132]